jgi:voltage-gated potassium channel
MDNIKRRVFAVFDLHIDSGPVSKIINLSIMLLIALNVVAVLLETVDTIAASYSSFFHIFEIVSIVVFTIEYLIRFWICTADQRYRHPVFGRVRYVVTPMAVVDLLAILPFYLPLLIPVDLRFSRALRLLRLFRVFKLARYTNALNILGRVLRNKKVELYICIFTIMILLTVASSIMYFVERQAQPEQFSSIPATMWWGVATLTTVGYGDVYPVTVFGKLIGALIAVLGIGMFALPAGILASGFAEEIQRNRRKECPHCGRTID